MDWFRQTSPYINTHRGKTFVVWFSGDMLDTSIFTSLVHDLTLLSHLGIRLVLVHGMRPQIDQQLAIGGLTPEYAADSGSLQPMRITTTETLPAVTNAVATVRSKLESAFSTGLPNSPMSGAQITLASGTFIVAKPYGIRDGIDYQHTGEVRKVRKQKIASLLDADMVTLLSPIGYSQTGEMFNLLSEDVAMHAAIALGADKLIYFHQDTGAINSEVREVSASSHGDLSDLIQANDNTQDLQSLHTVIERSMQACNAGVSRGHIVDAQQSDALLRELFTRDGSGLMIDSGNYDNIRAADSNSVNGIMGLIKPLIEDGTLLYRSEQDLEREIQNFYIIEREGSVICCASLVMYDNNTAELGCLVVHPDFRASGKASDILQHLTKTARRTGCDTLFVLSNRSGDWFLQQGFTEDNSTPLPETREATNNRGSKVFSIRL